MERYTILVQNTLYEGDSFQHPYVELRFTSLTVMVIHTGNEMGKIAVRAQAQTSGQHLPSETEESQSTLPAEEDPILRAFTVAIVKPLRYILQYELFVFRYELPYSLLLRE